MSAAPACMHAMLYCYIGGTANNAVDVESLSPCKTPCYLSVSSECAACAFGKSASFSLQCTKAFLVLNDSAPLMYLLRCGNANNAVDVELKLRVQDHAKLHATCWFPVNVQHVHLANQPSSPAACLQCTKAFLVLNGSAPGLKQQLLPAYTVDMGTHPLGKIRFVAGCVTVIVTTCCMLVGHLTGGGVAGVGVQAPWQRP